MKDIRTPKVGTTCPALTKENYKYHLSGDAEEFCICMLNDQACKGRVIHDPDDASNRFFSRGKCGISQKGLESCPAYGMSKESFAAIIRDKAEARLAEKLANLS